MIDLLRRLFGLAKPKPAHDISILHRLDNLCARCAPPLVTSGSRPFLPAATFVSHGSSVASASPVEAAAARYGPPASSNPGADWLQMRSAAGWGTLEDKPDGRQLFRAAAREEAHLDSADPIAVETPETLPLLDLGSQDDAGAESPEPLETADPTSAESLEIPAFHADRRGARRYPAQQLHRQWKILEGAGEARALLRNISTMGVSLELGAKRAIGASLDLTMITKSHGVTGPFKAQVVRLVSLPGGRWITCCVFEKPLEHEWLKTAIHNG